MNPNDPVVERELPVIRKIIQDETWLEGERRGCRVNADDRVVRERVCEVVLRIGQQLRDSITASIAATMRVERVPVERAPLESNAPRRSEAES
jgi:hypothetical protein